MNREFLLPDLGEGLPEAEIVSWHVAVGDAVTLNQTIAEVETAKAIVELPSPYEGIITQLFAAAGDVVEVGKPLIAYDLAVESERQVPELAVPEAEAPDVQEEQEVVPPNLVGYGAAPSSTARPQRRSRRDEPVNPPSQPGSLSIHSGAERPRSTPPVRRLARDLGIDLLEVPGTGEFGRITRRDVEAFLAIDAPTVSARQDDSRETRTPIKGVRKFTAAAMVQSAFTAPHVTCFHTIDVTETSALISRLRADKRWADARIGITAVAAKAVCLALGATPSLNARWDESAGEIIEYHYVNLGIAAATPRGLVVPNIMNAETLSLAELAGEIVSLASTAREGKTTPAALQGGTFSISNIGTFGIEAGTPILNPGEAGILAMGAVQRRPWEFEGEVALRDTMTLSLSFDHRLVDGEQGARFLRDVGGVLSDPALAMLY